MTSNELNSEKIERNVPLEWLVITNPLLNRKKLADLSKLSIEEILNLKPIIYVSGTRFDKLLYVLDGSHRVEVLRRKNVSRATVCHSVDYVDDPSESFRRVMSY